MAETLKRTPLYEEHRKLSAKLVPFGGFEMPVQYATGVGAEHRAVRERAGLFDISHMGEFAVRGQDAEAFTNYIVANDVARLEAGQALYGVMCNSEGGIVDDLVVYRFADRFRLVVNAANIDKDFDWIREHRADYRVDLADESDEVALLALQGPDSEPILARYADVELAEVGYYRFVEGNVVGVPCVVSRTGYTGEDGFEIYCEAAQAATIWRALLRTGPEALEGGGQAEGAVTPTPAGLGARDTLRLEMGYALYGNDIDETTTPLEARLAWTVKLDSGDFVGREALLEQKEKGVSRKLCGFELRDRGFPRPGYEITRDGASIGRVCSGTVGPTVGKGIGTAYLPVEHTEIGADIEVTIRDRPVPAEVVRMPFYTGGSLKR